MCFFVPNTVVNPREMWMGNRVSPANIYSDVALDCLYTHTVFVTQTKSHVRALFTNQALGPGQIIGFYTGNVVGEDPNKPDPNKSVEDRRRLATYTLELTSSSFVVPELPIRPNVDPMALINEPRSDATANASFQKVRLNDSQELFEDNARALRHVDSAWTAVAVVACRTILAGEEITLNYGKKYNEGVHGYVAGRGCSPPDGLDGDKIVATWPEHKKIPSRVVLLKPPPERPARMRVQPRRGAVP